MAGWTKHFTDLPTIALGSVGVGSPFMGTDSRAQSLSLAHLLDLFEHGEFDLVGLGRAVLSEPGWPSKIRDDRMDQIRMYSKPDEKRLL